MVERASAVLCRCFCRCYPENYVSEKFYMVLKFGARTRPSRAPSGVPAPASGSPFPFAFAPFSDLLNRKHTSIRTTSLIAGLFPRGRVAGARDKQSLPKTPSSHLVMSLLRLARRACTLVLLCSFSFVVGDGSLLSNFSGPRNEWVVSPAQQKQWWGRWPGACGGIKCSDAVVFGDNDGRRLPVTVYGALLVSPPAPAAYQDAGGDCSASLEQAMNQRFASYKFTCGYGGYTPDPQNGPCPDMQLVMMPNMPAHACSEVSPDYPYVGPPRVCEIPNGGLDLSCTDGLLCPNNLQTKEDYDPNLRDHCAAIGGDTSEIGPCYANSLDPSCGTAYLSFGKYEGNEAGDPPCDREGSAEPGMGPGKNSGRCATPCVTYRAYDERYWAAEQTFCPCLASRNMMPSVLRERPNVPQRASKYRFFLYHTEFALGFDASGGVFAAVVPLSLSTRPRNHNSLFV